ncbi:calponin homology domain-containing protein DDB_G0272472-like [Cottoperca gobio]|uniref:Calponin homology domain-containing protein DDB_G0272472-like n=1 Tax=Cottoperca gobio TaxID=56716 RepID=A0A6J2R0Q4_COTGO|nr:calponin homology domain-containing protein DDB_G0272472-like [Cottoperca gobio]
MESPQELQVNLCSASDSEDEYSQCALSRTLQALRQGLLETKAQNQELAAENAALKEQTVSWEKEKKKLLDEKDSLVSTLFMAKKDMVKALGSARAIDKLFDTQRKEINRICKEKTEEVCSLKESLHFQKMETEKAEQFCKAECDQLDEMKLSFDKTVIQLNEEWESRWLVRQKEVAAELETLQRDCEKKTSQVIQEKDDVITRVRKEMMALEGGNLDSLAKVSAIKMEIRQSETEWQTKHKVLEDRLRCGLAAKEEIFKKTQELQKQSREVEAKWLNKESKMEEEKQLLIQLNIKLQELALKTDKEKAKMKKEEKKAKKETEKRLKKERQEKEKREEKERWD